MNSTMRDSTMMEKPEKRMLRSQLPVASSDSGRATGTRVEPPRPVPPRPDPEPEPEPRSPPVAEAPRFLVGNDGMRLPFCLRICEPRSAAPRRPPNANAGGKRLREALPARGGLLCLALEAGEGRATRVGRGLGQFLFDPQQLIVLSHALAPGR